jgi:hypothetical protein
MPKENTIEKRAGITKADGRSVATFGDGEFNVEIYQRAPDNFTVRYGLQVKRRLDYSQAAHEFGLCVFHLLACDSRLDNRERGK